MTDQLAALTAAIEIRDDADGTDGLIEAITTKFDGEDVPLRGEEWRAVTDTPYSLVLTQWADSSERDIPTGPKVRVTFTVHVEEVCASARCGRPLAATDDVVVTPEGPRYHRECWEDMLDGIGAVS